ncbi:MAG: hypothetical protein GY940_41465, partial [bacterium]|nr:hypothetical protein [bacterium]
MKCSFENISESIITIVEDRKGSLWLGFRTPGILKVAFPNGELTAFPVVTRYDASYGLPDKPIKTFMIKDHVVFATQDGLFRFNEEKQIFVPDSMLGDRFAGYYLEDDKNNLDEEDPGGDECGKERWVFRMAEDREGNIWLHLAYRIIKAIPSPDGSFTIVEKPFLRIPPGQTNSIYPDPNGNAVWFATNDGLFRYDKSIEKNYAFDFKTMIREVRTNKRLKFEGYKIKKSGQPGQKQPYVFDYKDRNIQIRFAAPFFEGESTIRYRYRLEGHNNKWSAWAKDTKVDYINLDAGKYTFRVQAKNVYSNLSNEAEFQFRVLPPWHQTWWAYIGYALLFILLIYLIVKWRSGKLVREKLKLERIVQKRTAEIKDKNLQLESQTEQLTEQSEKLKEMDNMKSRFFANISHEFRTPLTLLMGPLEQMITDCSGREDGKKRKLTLMLRNAQRLLRLINQLLELSKLGSGKMKLQASKTGIISFVKGIASSFQLLAQQKELNLVFQGEEEAGDINLYIDHRKMEDIMSNLLVNAFKFTPPGGEIRVTVNVKENTAIEKKFPEGSVEISVCDTGSGIPEEQLPHIFDRFYQADGTYEHHQKGSGIGLALAKELVELHQGTIEAKSRKGEGSEFIVRLPRGNAHLEPDKIVETITEESPAFEIPMDIG